MTRNNIIKVHVEEKREIQLVRRNIRGWFKHVMRRRGIRDYDAVSLYPSATKRMKGVSERQANNARIMSTQFGLPTETGRSLSCTP